MRSLIFRTKQAEAGSAPVGFLFSAVLVLGLFASILHLIMFMHQRTVLIDIVGESARFGARYNAVPDQGEQRVLELAHNRATITDIETRHIAIGNHAVLRLDVEAELRVLGVQVRQKVSGHAVVEQAF